MLSDHIPHNEPRNFAGRQPCNKPRNYAQTDIIRTDAIIQSFWFKPSTGHDMSFSMSAAG